MTPKPQGTQHDFFGASGEYVQVVGNCEEGADDRQDQPRKESCRDPVDLPGPELRLFLGRVAAGRRERADTVKKNAQKRIWLHGGGISRVSRTRTGRMCLPDTGMRLPVTGRRRF